MSQLQDILPFTKKLSLLYIDEDQEILLKVGQELRKVFANVDDASDATMGLGFYKLNSYDIVIVDASSSIMSIEQLIKNIKEHNPSQEIIVTSSNTDKEYLLHLYTLGIFRIVTKPLNIQILLSPIIDLANKLKYQSSFLQEDVEKLRSDLMYERKRIGRFMLNEKKLTEKLKSFEDKVHIDRNIYELTRLPSRYALQEALKGEAQSLIYINIDHFDFINSIYGMGKANKLLKECANRLKMFLPNNAELFHITADEFVLLLQQPAPKQDIILAQQIQSQFKEAPVEFAEYSQFIAFSIGIDRGEGKQLFVNAKAASKEARFYGGDNIIVYSPHSPYMKEQRENLYWINVLKKAFDEDKIFTFYQPIVTDTESKVKHYEVLCRLMDENNVFIDANKFINSAKLIGFITHITKIVIDKAFKVFQNNDCSFSINISMYDLHERYLVDFLAYKCKLYNIDPKRVHLEIVEDIVLANLAVIDQQIEALKNQGHPVVVDDFSTKKSLYSRICDIQAEYIKIDGSFTREIETNKANYIIVQGIIDFAKKSGIKTIAEHIEDKRVYEIVKELGVDYVQGYFISKPAADLQE